VTATFKDGVVTTITLPKAPEAQGHDDPGEGNLS
jgi:hypothetical protein